MNKNSERKYCIKYGVPKEEAKERCEIKRTYDTYSKELKRKYGEDCAFKATWQVVSASLGFQPHFARLPNGDEKAVFWKNPNEWAVWRVDPYRKSKVEFLSRPDIAVLINDNLIVTVEVKNWEPCQYWNWTQIALMVLLRFIHIPQSVPQILLTTNDNFSNRERKYIEERGINIEKVHNFPLPEIQNIPEFGLDQSIAEMRDILEKYITLDRLTTGACDIEL